MLCGDGHVAELPVDVDHLKVDHLDAFLLHTPDDVFCRDCHILLPRISVNSALLFLCRTDIFSLFFASFESGFSLSSS